MSILPVNMSAGGLPASPLTQTQTVAEPRKGVSATQPSTPVQEVAKAVTRPVEQSTAPQSTDPLAQKVEVGAQLSEWKVPDAADELAEVRAEAARLTGELQAKGLLGSQAAARDETMIGKQAENAFAETRNLEAAVSGPTVTKVL